MIAGGTLVVSTIADGPLVEINNPYMKKKPTYEQNSYQHPQQQQLSPVVLNESISPPSLV